MCIRCQTQPPPFDALISAAVYDGLLKDIIHSFKYHNATYYKTFLAKILFDALSHKEIDCDLITFVPLHWTRMISRGYNQAALIARELARLLGLDLRYDILKKTRRTLPQVGLGRYRRKKNITGAFCASGVAGKAVLVVDDVVTTGQTAREVSRALKKAGASRVLFSSVGRMVV
jgi:ComF family protein